MSAEALLSLFDDLREDRTRESRPFSKDILEANALMHHPFALDDDVAEVVRQWCMKRQPCQFGMVAATRGQIHFCVLRERDLAEGDEGIAAKIAEGKRLWKQRAVSERECAPHGFLLVFASPRVALAAPDENLRRFSDKLLELAGWAGKKPRGRHENAVSSDFLFLRNPVEDAYYGFQFNVDYFAAAGDGRWWHDHRFPGGIGFTANSTGHMRHFLDWYAKPGNDHGQWALKQAMVTIDQAHRTKGEEGGKKGDPRAEGRVTWLLPLDERGRPMLRQAACPLNPTPKQLEGKDWTRYGGLLHTDHAVRAEFFADREDAVTASKPYYMDLTYLYDRTQADFINFTAGVRVSEEEVYAETGRPEKWATRSTGERSGEPSPSVAALVKVCGDWPRIADYANPDLPD
jgi:hypothetical protein